MPSLRLQPFRKAMALLAVSLIVLPIAVASAAPPKGPYPPVLPGGAALVTDTAPQFIQVPAGITFSGKFEVAKTAPTVDFMYYPGQNWPGNPWSDWGDGVAADGKYYSAIGDHKYDALVYEYDSQTKTLRILADLKKFLNMPKGEYAPGKVHSRIGVGKDGCLYYSTHRGSATYTDGPGGQRHKYKGDWVLKTDPKTGQTEVLMHGEVPESIPVGRLDPERLIYYGGTQQNEVFFALDCPNKKVLFVSKPGDGPQRYVIFSSTTGKVYMVGKNHKASGTLGCYDPKTNQQTEIKLPAGAGFDIRSCTEELAGGIVYVSDYSGNLWKFDVNTEKPEKIGPLSIGRTDSTITTLDADPSGRYLYYVGGSHGGIAAEGMPIKQYDTKTNTVKVIAFLNPYYATKYNYNPDGTYGSAISPDGSKMYVTMNGCHPPNVGAKYWYAVSLFVIHIPESERQP